MKRALRLFTLLLAVPALPALAGGGMMLAPPVINIQPHGQVLDPKCVDRLKGTGASAARAAHECRKTTGPGSPEPLATHDKAEPAVAAAATPAPPATAPKP